nr:ketosteroid isomerase family protein [Mycolicibacterium tokaiense]
MTAHTDADLLAAVEQSPQAAARRDRSGWVGLFTDDASVEDPVGSVPHRGPEAIGLFFDTFIAPRDITFHPHADIVCGSTVIRDVTLEVRMGPAVSIDVAAILRYALVDVGGELKIRELQAFWELPPMLWRFARREYLPCRWRWGSAGRCWSTSDRAAWPGSSPGCTGPRADTVVRSTPCCQL